jgi:hypothetical protein
MKQLGGKCSIIFLGLFLHLFSYELQVEAACNIVRLTKGIGSIISGKSGGWDKAGIQGRKLDIQSEGKNDQPSRFRHDKDSFTKMWKEVSIATQTKWDVDVQMVPDDMKWRHQTEGVGEHNPVWLYFTMTRLEG